MNTAHGLFGVEDGDVSRVRVLGFFLPLAVEIGDGPIPKFVLITYMGRIYPWIR